MCKANQVNWLPTLGLVGSQFAMVSCRGPCVRWYYHSYSAATIFEPEFNDESLNLETRAYIYAATLFLHSYESFL